MDPSRQPVFEFTARAAMDAAASGDSPECRFRMDPANRLLTCNGREVPLPGRAFDALEMLVRHPGELLTKEEMLAQIWAGAFVEESNLTVAVSTLRRALNEDPQDRRYIQTVARRGYRFIADVREGTAPASAATASQRTVPSAAAAPAAAAAPSAGASAAAPALAPPVQRPASESSPAQTPAADPIAPEPATEPATEATSRVPSPGRGFSWLPGAGRGGWAVLLVAVAVLCVCAATLLRPREKIASLAVLPFTATSSGFQGGGAEAEVVLLGMTDAVVERLERQLVVRPTSSMLRYSGKDTAAGGTADAVAAGREQGVDAVLTGTVTGRGRMPRLELRLIGVRGGKTLWSGTFDGNQWQDLPQVVARAADGAARELRRFSAAPAAVPGPERQPVIGNGPAYPLYLRGRYFWNRRTVDGLKKSVDYFKQAIAADPNYAPAYAGLADSYALLASFSVEPGSSANVDARSAAFSAIHLDPALAEPHASLGMIYFFTDWDPNAAATEFERAIALNPNYATAHHWYALDLAAMGRFPQALYEIRLAQKLDPLSLIIGTNVGFIEYLARDDAAATRDLGRVLELDPEFARARTRLGMVELAEGRTAMAVADLTRALSPAASGAADTAGPDPFVQGLLGDAEARAGDRAGAMRLLEGLRSQPDGPRYVPPISRALVLLGMGDKAAAVAECARSVDDHSTAMVYARVDPVLDGLRTDPAFTTLLQRLKF